MNEFICKYKKIVVTIYVFLSIIKLFTIRIDFVREEDPTIYFKFYPTIENHIMACVEEGQLKEYYKNKYVWYEKEQYWEIFHSPGGMQNIIGYAYGVIISLWWIYSICFICGAIWLL